MPAENFAEPEEHQPRRQFCLAGNTQAEHPIAVPLTILQEANSKASAPGFQLQPLRISLCLHSPDVGYITGRF